MKHLIAVFILLGSTTAFAQQPVSAPPQQPASEQALGNRLMNEIGNNLQCQAALITAQRELEELKKHNVPEKAPAK
jgi:hypothetical protein